VIGKIGRVGRISAAACLIGMLLLGCGSGDEKKATSDKPVMAPPPLLSYAQTEAATAAPAAPVAATTEGATKNGADSSIAVEVDGVKLAKAQLDADMEKKLITLKSQIPPENVEQAKVEIRKGLIEEFVVRTLLKKEITAKKVTVAEKEINDILEEMKTQLPPGVTMDEMLKKNKIDPAKIREEITMNIQINKLVMKDLGGKVKIADKEVTDFYNKNLDKFKQPESVHARHILVSKVAGDTEKIKTEKKAKAEDLRKQLVAGADFAELAKKNSDCPSKENGGDLGTFSRGQMVKPFEDAAFTQEKNVTGPVVETDFGYHIIQVLEHKVAQVTKLDGETKKQIQTYLERQKQQGAFDTMMKKLKASANIVVYGK
jgi:peptidyl-prolyl cis-trans isomerase C